MKPHYPILDGLRGVAAVLVVLFHIFEAHWMDYTIHPVHHGYLAVDFFFLLSGFVVGYAYDDRWGRMSTWDFFKIRLVRLHPLVVLSVFFGALGYWLDPYIDQKLVTSGLQLVAIMLLGFTVLPTPDIRGWGETHSLDGTLWSLLQEYIANLLYALFGRRLSQRGLAGLVLLAAAALLWMALHRGDVGTGWGYDSFGYGLIRMLYPFFAGLLLFRSGRLLRVPGAFAWCSLALVVVLCLPYFPFNGLYEAACIILVFPLLVAVGAGSTVGRRGARICKVLGDLSYPVYITHYPFIYTYTNWVAKYKLSLSQAAPVAVGVLLASLALGWLSLKLYDEPVRAWLRRHVVRW